MRKPTKPDRRWWPLAAPARGRAGAIRAVSRPPVIDPLAGPKLALAGRVVTMNPAFAVRDDAVLYLEKGSIVEIRPRRDPPPAGFESVEVVDTGGTIYPGLIELHNHLAYDALPPWSPVPKRFEHRGQWPDHADYRRLISGPMTVVGRTPSLLPALVRYVECKCLLGGVTTSQGIRLNSNAGIQRFYRGIVRNVEQTDEPDLPEAKCRIPDVDARSARSFRAQIRAAAGKRCCLLHLSEGITEPAHPDSPARRHFLALEVAPDDWAVNDALGGIHSTGLLDTDFAVLGERDASIVWSPLSNLLLYGETTRVKRARDSGVRIGLGSDWSPSGSKNLLGELKVAHLHSEHALGGALTPRDLATMATRTAAEILKWDAVLGSLEPGKRADLIVVDGSTGDPYLSLIAAKETDLRLVMIQGVARYGIPSLMRRLAPKDQTVKIGGSSRRLYLKQETADPDVAAVSLDDARQTLERAFRDLRKLARKIERPTPALARSARPADHEAPVTWTLALDEIHETGAALRPRLPYANAEDFTGPARLSPAGAAASRPLSEILGPIAIDPLTVADDATYLDRIETQPNVPEPIRAGLGSFY